MKYLKTFCDAVANGKYPALKGVLISYAELVCIIEAGLTDRIFNDKARQNKFVKYIREVVLSRCDAPYSVYFEDHGDFIEYMIKLNPESTHVIHKNKIYRKELKTPDILSATEQVNHPNHYNDYDIEVIEMMRRIWGDQAVVQFAQMNAFKYRMRAGHKDDIDQELAKERWYLDYANTLKKPTNHE